MCHPTINLILTLNFDKFDCFALLWYFDINFFYFNFAGTYRSLIKYLVWRRDVTPLLVLTVLFLNTLL